MNAVYFTNALFIGILYRLLKRKISDDDVQGTYVASSYLTSLHSLFVKNTIYHVTITGMTNYISTIWFSKFQYVTVQESEIFFPYYTM